MDSIIKASQINKNKQILNFPQEGEAIDLFLLQKYVTPNYQPRENPWVMDVGAASAKIGLVTKVFHLTEFNIPYSNSTVVGINIHKISGVYRAERGYDILNSGPLEGGDALQDFTWVLPFMGSEENIPKYDLTIIRNPDLINLEKWRTIFRKALQYTREQGSVVTLIRETDVEKYEQLLKGLKKGFGIEPTISEETKIENDLRSNNSENYHHTIGIFKSLPNR